MDLCATTQKRARILALAMGAVVGLATAGVPGSARAASGHKVGYIGLLGGLTFPTTASGTFTWGATAMWRNSPRMGLGAFVQLWGAGVRGTTNSGTGSASTSGLTVGGELNYVLDSGVRIGSRVGVTSVNSSFDATQGSSTVDFNANVSSFFVQPLIGYDYRVGEFFSVGGEVSFALSFSTQTPNQFNFLLAPKFWF